ncbi:MGMT family protein [Oceanispirochaeta crateris]|uniref:MGMT family protein n=1 Tax=Oceanispirochaeta crateris TaxID=2518645 RepID=A0A5C1QRG8_9SPIO|nr:MGMT family protein [Oceanispirochaeta crateris]QEN09224.1 MGMT family protein [Oceanispirochaeta crateris]
MEDFSLRVCAIIRDIPQGRVCTYGRIAAMAGSSRGARQVSRLLYSSSRKRGLPWHRVVNAAGGISLGGESGELQRALLESEGVGFSKDGKVILSSFLWNP